MSKIYVVVSSVDYAETECVEFIEKAFSTIEKAKAYMNEQLSAEEVQRVEAMRCMECNGQNKECPLYVEPDYLDDECGNFHPYHEDTGFRIEEIDFEE